MGLADRRRGKPEVVKSVLKLVVKTLKPEREPDKYHRIMGVDTSSTGIAWTCTLDGDDVIDLGKIDLSNIRSMGDKLNEIYIEWAKVLHDLKPDHTFVEKSIFVKNPATARTLSYIVGSVMCVTVGNGYEATDVEPATWKAFMGYHNLSRQFVADAANALGQKEGKKFCERLRKSQTWRVIKHNYPSQVEEFRIADTDHDISDSWGISLYGYHTLGKELYLNKGKEISLDLEKMNELGLEL